MKYAALSDKGRVRDNNEDNLRVVYNQEQEAFAFMVADGMGGCIAGETASRLAVEILEEELLRLLSEQSYDSNLLQDIINAIQKANQGIYQYAIDEMSGVPMGTTISLGIFVDSDTMAVAHIGDSRIYRIRDKEIKQITIDHSYVGELVRHGLLDKDDAVNHPRRNQITRALGYEPEVQADVSKIDIRSGDIFIFCTDGLYNKLSEQEILNMMDMDKDLCAICYDMVETANLRGGDDNISVIIVFYE